MPMIKKFDKYVIFGMSVLSCSILKRISDSEIHIGFVCSLGRFCESVHAVDIFETELSARKELKNRLEHFTKINNAELKKAAKYAAIRSEKDE